MEGKGGRDGLGDGVGTYTLVKPCVKWITNENLLLQHREHHSRLCGDLNGEGIQKRRSVCIADSLCRTAETNRTL